MIQIHMYDDKISIWNEGFLPEGLTLDTLRRVHPSRPRNPVIADVCFKGGYIDAWGRGTVKIIDSCKAANLPEPEMMEQDGGFLLTIFKDILNEAHLVKLGLNERQIKAVMYVKEKGFINNSKYQEINNIGKTTATEELRQLVEIGLLIEPTAKGRGAKYGLKN